MTHLDNVGPVTHQLPPYGMNPLPCCGRDWRRVPRSDRFSALAEHVDCRGLGGGGGGGRARVRYAPATFPRRTGLRSCAAAAVVLGCAVAIGVTAALLALGWWR